MARVYIGTSGFFYKHWKGVFYPQDLPQSKWFEYYCRHFDTVELNVSFYRLPKKETFEKWRRITSISDQSRAHLGGERRCRPFVFAIKGNRYITHVKRLKDCQEAVGRFFENAGGAKLAAKNAKFERSDLPRGLTSSEVVLWQLPPRFRAFRRSDLQGGLTSSGHLGRLREFLGLLPKDWRHAFEFRDESWNDTRVFKVLKAFGAAVVFQDFPDWPIASDTTADFVYLRFHGRQTLYSSCYTEEELKNWAEKIQGWLKKDLDVYAYFNNDALGYAVENARTLKKLVAYT